MSSAENPPGELRRAMGPKLLLLFTTALSVALVGYVSIASENGVGLLGGTTSLLILGVFAVVNLAVPVLRRDTVEHRHFRANTALALVGSIACLYLVTPWAGRNAQQYQVGSLLLIVGLVVSALVWLSRRAFGTVEVSSSTPGGS